MQTQKNIVSTEDKGATLVEYALLVALIAVLCIAAVTLVGNRAAQKFSVIASAVAPQ